MQRTPEPELMNDAAQARAYAEADFAVPHQYFVTLFGMRFPAPDLSARVLDLGCGPGDVTLRFARAYPQAHIDAVDGAEAMLAHAHRRLASGADAALAPRVRLIHGYLPGAALPESHYGLIISNSLLHHLAEPAVLWQTVRQVAAPGTPVFIMDLLRPDSREHAEALVQAYAADEAEVLRHDFYHSLLAAYRPEEIIAQLESAGLRARADELVLAQTTQDKPARDQLAPEQPAAEEGLRVEVISDRHLIVYGQVPHAGTTH